MITSYIVNPISETHSSAGPSLRTEYLYFLSVNLKSFFDNSPISDVSQSTNRATKTDSIAFRTDKISSKISHPAPS